MSRFNVRLTPLAGLLYLERQQLGDERGFLSRLFCQDILSGLGWPNRVAAVNHSFTAQKGTVRGMHYQLQPYAEAKLVTCLQGKVLDVAVDLRPSSSTFLHWHGEILSAENHSSLLIPQGFAHGFQTLTDNVELIYCHSEHYHQPSERGLNPLDPTLGIKWPLVISQLSDRDYNEAWLDESFNGVNL
ncbi:dTDP-4-dehydrorhamnose 3,5-epimerase [Shewanella putrefaciens]|nr:dTDP-4-dehydrorhamnose 3,5-epimerase [Shewanella putrefaciens]